jgi:hypothetical protein
MATTTSNAPAETLTLDELEAAAARLNAAEREELLQRLIELEHPANPEVETAWDEEIARRLDEVRSGKVQLLDGEEVMREMREKYGLS